MVNVIKCTFNSSLFIRAWFNEAFLFDKEIYFINNSQVVALSFNHFRCRYACVSVITVGFTGSYNEGYLLAIVIERMMKHLSRTGHCTDKLRRDKKFHTWHMTAGLSWKHVERRCQLENEAVSCSIACSKMTVTLVHHTLGFEHILNRELGIHRVNWVLDQRDDWYRGTQSCFTLACTGVGMSQSGGAS